MGGGASSFDPIQNDMNRMTFTDAADEVFAIRKNQLGPFQYHYFERPNASTDALNLARSLFDLREYRKCAHILKPYASEKYQSALFLHNYSLYLVSEYQKEEDSLQQGERIESASSP